MKRVFKNEMVAHVWASRSQDDGRNATNNFYFVGPTLYSYGSHFVIGHHMPDRYQVNGKAIVAMNASSYSNSTSKQQSEARQAVRHLETIYIPGLNYNAIAYLERSGSVDLCATIQKQIADAADAACNTRIRPDTRAAHYAVIRERLEVLRLLQSCDIADKSGLDKSVRIRQAKAWAELRDFGALIPADGTDKNGALPMARMLNLAKWRAEYAEKLGRLRGLIDRTKCDFGPDSANEQLRNASDSVLVLSYVETLAKKIGCSVPRAILRDVSRAKARMPALEHAAALRERARYQERYNEARAAFPLQAAESFEYGARQELQIMRTNARALLPTDTAEESAQRVAEIARYSAEYAAIAKRDSETIARVALDNVEACLYGAAAHSDPVILKHAGKLIKRASDALTDAGYMRAEVLATNPLHIEALVMQVSRYSERYQALQEAAAAAAIPNWRAHVIADLPRDIETAGALLRMSTDGARVETSQGAEIPVSVCPMVWSAACQCVKAGVAHDFGNNAPRLGHFALNRISENGALSVGCHHIEFVELIYIAELLGYPNAADWR